MFYLLEKLKNNVFSEENLTLVSFLGTSRPKYLSFLLPSFDDDCVIVFNSMKEVSERS